MYGQGELRWTQLAVNLPGPEMAITYRYRIEGGVGIWLRHSATWVPVSACKTVDGRTIEIDPQRLRESDQPLQIAVDVYDGSFKLGTLREFFTYLKGDGQDTWPENNLFGAEDLEPSPDPARLREAAEGGRLVFRNPRLEPRSGARNPCEEKLRELAEAQRKREAEARRAAEAARREEARQAEAARREEEARQAEAARREEEARQGDAARREEEARQKDAARRQAEAQQSLQRAGGQGGNTSPGRGDGGTAAPGTGSSTGEDYSKAAPQEDPEAAWRREMDRRHQEAQRRAAEELRRSREREAERKAAYEAAQRREQELIDEVSQATAAMLSSMDDDSRNVLYGILVIAGAAALVYFDIEGHPDAQAMSGGAAAIGGFALTVTGFDGLAFTSVPLTRDRLLFGGDDWLTKMRFGLRAGLSYGQSSLGPQHFVSGAEMGPGVLHGIGTQLILDAWVFRLGLHGSLRWGEYEAVGAAWDGREVVVERETRGVMAAEFMPSAGLQLPTRGLFRPFFEARLAAMPNCQGGPTAEDLRGGDEEADVSGLDVMRACYGPEAWSIGPPAGYGTDAAGKDGGRGWTHYFVIGNTFDSRAFGLGGKSSLFLDVGLTFGGITGTGVFVTFGTNTLLHEE